MSLSSVPVSKSGSDHGLWVWRSCDGWFSRLRRALLSSCFAKKCKLGSDPSFWGWHSSDRGVSRLRRALLSFASPKESKQRKGDPGRRPATRGPLRYSVWAGSPQEYFFPMLRIAQGAAELAATRLKQSSPFSAQPCVAQRLTRGPESVMERPAARFSKRCSGSAAWVCGGFPRPVDSAEQRRASRK